MGLDGASVSRWRVRHGYREMPAMTGWGDAAMTVGQGGQGVLGSRWGRWDEMGAVVWWGPIKRAGRWRSGGSWGLVRLQGRLAVRQD